MDDDEFSDDSSDEEFLTRRETGGSQDREALIRRKLMENFYGKSLPAEEQEQGALDEKAANLSEQEDEEKQGTSRDVEIQETSDDLDSPYFDPDAHTSKYVLQANMHDVLEVEERLALQVRTLDSTMQTLVYENYSKFIDATDAIRSIGVSVTANDEGLERLSNGIHVIDEKSQAVEDALGTLRDAVAEKIRVKRLLTRLDALLKLPQTLREQIKKCQYRLATKSYLSAYAILKKHTEGFESLRIIEKDCFTIMMEMVQTIQRKIMHWSGLSSNSFRYDHDLEELDLDDSRDSQPDKEDSAAPLDIPKSVSEIFECASTLLILLPNDNKGQDGVTFDSELSALECKSAALSATVRYLERVLDSHQIELQETMFNSSFVDDTFDPPVPEVDAVATKQINLIPTSYLDHILEAATLFNISFSIDGTPSLSDDDRDLLIAFVKESFSSFLLNVKTLLLERVNDDAKDDESEEKESIMAGDEEDTEGDEAYSEISAAMTHLIRSVRELASGLTLPDVGVCADFASSLVEQAVDITEMMVRKRVAQKFMFLRHHVIQNCLAPFVNDAIAFSGNDETARVIEIVQMASVALSDGLQLVDDTVKSILTGGIVVSDLKGVDYDMVKEAVQDCCRHFANWLAGTLEVIAGCENPDQNFTIETEAENTEADEDATVERTNQQLSDENVSLQDGENKMQELHVMEKVKSSLEEILENIDQSATEECQLDLVLAMSEMCRLAQRSVMENINQSISSTAGSGSRKHNRDTGIFALSDSSSKVMSLNENDANVSTRFLLAASRILVLYGVNRGSDAALHACKELDLVASQDGDDFPEAPRDAIFSMLHVVKETSIACANIFGGERRAGPEPEPLQDEEDVFNSGGAAAFKTTGLSSAKGLHLDVERMFMEKDSTFPHLNCVIDFSRNQVIFLVLKVAFNALVERIRTCTFTAKGYRQMQVDVLFLRFLLPHYIKDEKIGDDKNGLTLLNNVLNDAINNTGERCIDLDCVGQDKMYDPVSGESITLQSIIRTFMEDKAPQEKEEQLEHVKTKFIIEEEDFRAN
mmetsp:Transcript_14153/g.20904  ORF Transcript_14153/g.20904 Transcript_14153/m.20904 type:complete len:1048 (+) Transcript_14153:74-3217(+)